MSITVLSFFSFLVFKFFFNNFSNHIVILYSKVQDVLLIQPIKVFIVAVFVAVFVKKLDDEERGDIDDEVENLGMNKNWLRDNTDERGGLFDRSNTESLLPPSNVKLGAMRTLRYREKRLRAISKEILLYLTFTGVAAVLAYSLRDYQAYYQTTDIEKTFKLNDGDTFRAVSVKIHNIP